MVTSTAEPLRHADWREAFRADNPSGAITGVRQKTWSRLSAVVKEMAFSGAFEVDRAAAYARVVVILDEVGGRIHARTARKAPMAGPDAPHRIYFVPAARPSGPMRTGSATSATSACSSPRPGWRLWSATTSIPISRKRRGWRSSSRVSWRWPGSLRRNAAWPGPAIRCWATAFRSACCPCSKEWRPGRRRAAPGD